jgi:hypothetical protein
MNEVTVEEDVNGDSYDVLRQRSTGILRAWDSWGGALCCFVRSNFVS